MKNFRIVDRVNPMVTFSIIILLFIGSIVLGWYPISIVILFIVLSSIKVKKVSQKYGFE